MRLGIDLMGGDLPPQAIFEAVLQVASTQTRKVSLVVISEEAFLSALNQQYRSFVSSEKLSIEFVRCESHVKMEESPLLAVRRKRNSSIGVGVKLLREKKIDGFLSNGNTGALVAFSTLALKRLPGVTRPALLVTLPSLTGKVAVLDVGANIVFKGEDMVAFAKMGSVYQQIWGVRRPKIGLLNIGSEEVKGTKEVKESYHLLQETFGKSFVGNLEGREVFQGKVDVLVTDGFTGNIFLKTCEGASSFLLEYLQSKMKARKNGMELLASLHEQFNYSEHPGALLIGVDGLVIKCHGYSNIEALMSGIKGAIYLIQNRFIEKLKAKLS